MGSQEEINELRRQVERLSLFHDVGKALASTLELQKILQTIMEKINPRGVAVVIEARHLCMIMRGVEKQNSLAVTSAMCGVFRDDQRTREEFLSHVRSRG